jgi:hypothetical protein
MDDAKSLIDLAREHGFWGAVAVGVTLAYAAVTRRWIVMPGMADLQAENARLTAIIVANGIDPVTGEHK